MAIQRTRLDFNREKQVIVNLILNTKYCERILPIAKDNYFESKYASVVIKWVRNYYDLYSVAPKEHINELYEEYSGKLEEPVREQISNVLQHLSDVADSEVHNIQYLVDNANELFREKHLENQNKALEKYLKEGDLISAENVMLEQYHGIGKTERGFIAFDDEEFIKECIRNMVMQQDIETAFFKFSGRLGEFIGPCDRGWFIAYLAPAKRGKTTYMLDAAIDSVRQRLNTVVISLEMLEKPLIQRYALAITGIKPEEKDYIVMTPVMDCRHNQNGSCEKGIRVGCDAVITDDGFATYESFPNWIPCTVCREDKKEKMDFKPSAWKVPVEKKTIIEGDYIKKVYKFNKFFGKYGRIIHMPSKSVTVSDIQNEVRVLKDNENFIPDVIVIDYADLIKPDVANGTKRHELDEIWEQLRAWGQREHVLIISASQTNRVSANVEYIKDVHVAEDYSKIAKLDIAIGLCQTDEMKELGIMNINKVAHRHKEYIQSHVCTVLQEMSHQQSTLDSEFIAL